MRRQWLASITGLTSLGMFAGSVLFAAPPELPPNYPRAQYDEAKIPAYTLPNPLVLQNGQKVTDVKTWRADRRVEILKLFETNVYGRTVVGRPKEMTWETTSPATNILDGTAITKTVTIYFAGKKDGPKMDLQIILPANAKAPAPIFFDAWIFWWRARTRRQPNRAIARRSRLRFGQRRPRHG